MMTSKDISWAHCRVSEISHVFFWRSLDINDTSDSNRNEFSSVLSPRAGAPYLDVWSDPFRAITCIEYVTLPIAKKMAAAISTGLSNLHEWCWGILIIPRSTCMYSILSCAAQNCIILCNIFHSNGNRSFKLA